MKKLNIYGVELTEIENMMFSKWIANNHIAMNTLTEGQRYELTINWLDHNKTNSTLYTSTGVV